MDIVYVAPRPLPQRCFQLVAVDFDEIETVIGPYVTTSRNSGGEWTFSGALGTTSALDGDWVCTGGNGVYKVDMNNLGSVGLQEIAGPNATFVTENP